jgi:hypothetical protein
MAAFVSAASAAVQGTSLVISAPASITNGDLLLLNLVTRGDSTITPPSGWTHLVSRYIANAEQPDSHVYYKIASSESGSYTWGISPSLRTTGAITVWSGIDGTTPIESYSDTSYITNDTTIRFGSVTTTSANQMVVLLGQISVNPPPSFNALTDWTEHVDFYQAVLRTRVGVLSREYASAGSTGDIDVTLSGSTVGKHGFALVLKNAAVSLAGFPVVQYYYNNQR